MVIQIITSIQEFASDFKSLHGYKFFFARPIFSVKHAPSQKNHSNKKHSRCSLILFKL